MKPVNFLRILSRTARLKTTYRHCFTDDERRESVADHSWRIALMAMLLTGEEEFKDFDMDRVIRMCLIHDLGETFTGDIPAFRKSSAEAGHEDALFEDWVWTFPNPQREEWLGLLSEMNDQKTPEAKLYKALDKLEAVISHNESDITTWLPLEFDLQFNHGRENVTFSPYLTDLKAAIDEWSEKKIEDFRTAESAKDKPKQGTKREKSCGAVVFTKESGEIRYVLVEQRSGNHSFPKGHVEPGETEEQTALREIWEETGLHPVILPGFRDGEAYEIRKKPGTMKDVVYFIAEYENQPFSPSETDAVSVDLYSFEEALDLLPTESRKNVLIHANEWLKRRGDA